LSRVRFDNGKTPSIIRQFLIDQLRFNDNTTIITALAAATVPTKPPERNEIVMTEIKVDHTPEDIKLLNQALGEIDRYRSMDRLIPSTHNVVTIAAIEFYLVLSMADLVPNDPRAFFPLTRLVRLPLCDTLTHQP
jgi:transcription initiation factor TFIID subunit 2